jgi:hypothetical protein
MIEEAVSLETRAFVKDEERSRPGRLAFDGLKT